MENDRLVRKNGLTWPFSFQQVLSVLLYLFDMFIVNFEVFLAYDKNFRIYYSVLHALVYAGMVLAFVLLSILDPTDPIVKIYKESNAE